MKAIHVSDGAVPVTELREKLEDALRLEAHDHGVLPAAVEILVGWWLLSIIEALREPTRGIPASALAERVHSIFRELRPSTLPVDAAIANLLQEWTDVAEDRRFIQQLQIIEVEQQLQLIAWLDYLKATKQFSEWTRLQLLQPSDVEAYHRRLTDDWQFERAVHAAMPMAEPAQQGKLVYFAIMRLERPIRPDLRDAWIMRGSFHELADHLRVGWHPSFDQLLGAD